MKRDIGIELLTDGQVHYNISSKQLCKMNLHIQMYLLFYNKIIFYILKISGVRKVYESVCGLRKLSGTFASYTARALLFPTSSII